MEISFSWSSSCIGWQEGSNFAVSPECRSALPWLGPVLGPVHILEPLECLYITRVTSGREQWPPPSLTKPNFAVCLLINRKLLEINKAPLLQGTRLRPHVCAINGLLAAPSIAGATPNHYAADPSHAVDTVEPESLRPSQNRNMENKQICLEIHMSLGRS